MQHLRRTAIGLLLSLAFFNTPALSQVAWPTSVDDVARDANVPDAEDAASVLRNSAPPPAVREEHPLQAALEFARVRHEFIQRHVRDFTCILAKRERIEGRLGTYEFLRTKARLRLVSERGVVEPYSVFMHFLAPTTLKGRRVLFVEGENEGKMLVRNGGRRFSYVTVRIAPDSDAARRQSRYPITELDLENVARRLIEKADVDMRADPAGENTEVRFFRDAKVDGRTCTRIQVVHPHPDPGVSFHLANVYVDDELHVPIRVEGYDWPDSDTEDPPLLEEYTFMRLRLNVGLSDADFSPSLLQD